MSTGAYPHSEPGRTCVFHLALGLWCVIAAFCPASARAGDWPQWRYDAAHSAAAPDELPEKLHLQWTRVYTKRVQAWDDPYNNDLMTYDRAFEPTVMDGRMFVGFNDSDKVVALDAETGKQLWVFYTDGPVRLATAAWKGKVYAACDDGHLYCIDAAGGRLEWKFHGGPSAHKVLGNGRVISMWPARGGPVIRDGKVYFAAGIWPFLGTFIYALDAETGEVVWINDRTGALYSLQPHASSAFAAVAPQGTLVATKDLLLVPGGRSLPAGLDRKTGLLRYFENSGVTGGGGSFVIADEKHYFVHTRGRGVRALGLTDTRRTSLGFYGRPVLAGDYLYVAGRSYAGAGSAKARDVIKAVGPNPWVLEADAGGDLIKAGGRLYAAGKHAIVAVELPKGPGGPKVIWSHPVEGQVVRLLAAGGRLFAVTLDGRIMAFGGERRAAAVLRDTPRPLDPGPAATRLATEILDRSRAGEGYALCYGVGDGKLLEALVKGSKLHFTAVDPDAAKVDRLRRRFDSAGLYGRRVAVHKGEPVGFKAPGYIGSLVVVGEPLSAKCRDRGTPTLKEAFRSVRPYGGALWLENGREQTGELIVREGAPANSADWSHQYGDMTNSVKSDDRLVRLPLGVLWFGGNSNESVLPKHGRGPAEQVVAGRLIIEGPDTLAARDVYTGRPLWKVTFDRGEFGTFGVYYDETQPSQRTLMGANVRGTNYVATADRIYVALSSGCRVLDAATGKTVAEFRMPPYEEGGGAPEWGFVGVYGDLLLGGWGFARYSRMVEGGDAKPVDLWGSLYSAPMDLSAGMGLVAFDRRTGKVIWKVKAEHSFIHNGIVAGEGRIYCLDKLPPRVADALRRRGRAGRGRRRIVALDARTGKAVWERREGVFGSWLAYSKQHDILLQATDYNGARCGSLDEGGIAAYSGSAGRLLWENSDIQYYGPCIIHNDTVITNSRYYAGSAGALSLLDGSRRLVKNPITGRLGPWVISRSYGCNSMIASECLLMFRSASAAYYDLQTRSGTGNLGGFRSGCTSNLVAANGVLNAPDYTRGCTCPYQNQTSLALVHVPDIKMERWTAQYGALNYYDFSDYEPIEIHDEVKRVGINFGAPGDRMASSGTLWLDYPAVGGASYSIPVRVEPEKRSVVHEEAKGPLGFALPMEARRRHIDTFRRHEAFVRGALPWVAASCARGVRSVAIDLQTGQGTQSVTVGRSGDDAEETAPGRLETAAKSLILGGNEDHPRAVGLRFTGLNVSRDADVRSACLQFTSVFVKGIPRDEKAELAIRAIASDDVPAFGKTKGGLAGLALTKAAVQWSAQPWRSPDMTGEKQRTPDLAPLVREVIRRAGWRPGNAMAFVITGNGRRTAHAFDGRAMLAPELHITTGRNQAERAYTVRLYFAELEGEEPGRRVFDVSIQGQKVLGGFDVAKEAGGPNRGIFREFRGVRAAGELLIEFDRAAGSKAEPVISGVEVIAEGEP